MSEASVFQLISDLCHSIIDKSARKTGKIISFRRCRAKAFEILLKSSGSPSIATDPVRDLDVHLFDMRMKATTMFHRRRNDELEKCLEGIEKDEYFESEDGKAILTFLHHLRATEHPDTFMALLPNYPFGLFSALQSAHETNPYCKVNPREMFNFPDLLDVMLPKNSPYLKGFNAKLGGGIFTQSFLETEAFFRRPLEDILKPKFSAIPKEVTQEEKLSIPNSIVVPNSILSCPRSERTGEILALDDFLCDLRALCMGYRSDSFIFRENRLEFRPQKRLRVENLTVNTLRQYIQPFLEFGTCMKRLLLLVASGSPAMHEGFIFHAFSMSVDQYLSHVRLLLSLEQKQSLLAFSCKIEKIADQVTALARICHVNPNTREPPKALPSGAQLLKYLLSEASTTMRSEIFLMLSNIVVKCMEFYLAHLEQWIFDGKLQDPHGELFIFFYEQYEYDTKRFFDKAYGVQKDLIPDFLQDFGEMIVLCGKYAMLLKAFKPLHPLFSVPKPSLCVCLSDSQVSALRRNVESYSAMASAVCGPRITVEEIHRRKTEKMETLKRLVEEKRLENLQLWEIERMEAKREAIRAKQEQLRELKRQMDAVKEEKEARKRQEVAQELIHLEQQRLVEEEELKRVNEEQLKRIQEYRELNELAEKKLARVCNENYQSGMKKSDSDILNANETMSELARNRARVLGSTNFSDYENCDNRKLNVNLPEDQMTPCQRNKLKVMSHEFNIDVPMDTQLSRAIQEETMTELERNRRRILYKDLNSNTDEHAEANRNSLSLCFETERMRNRRKILESEFDIAIPTKEKLTPMSTTSDCTESFASASAGEKFSTPEEEVKELPAEEEIPEEIASLVDESEAVDVEEVKIQVEEMDFLEDIMQYRTSILTSYQDKPPEIASDDLSRLNAVSMKEFLRLSVVIPLECHMAILNGEIMKIFLEDLDILGHWQSLRNYFLLMDGEFGSHICNGLIERLERGARPAELLNFHTLHAILDTSFGVSVAGGDKNSDRLSFIVSTIPEKFDFLSPDALDDLKLTYRVEWPVNLILSPETVQQYDSIFQYLLKVRRMGWILENVFQHLKDLSRRQKRAKSSPHFRHIQVMRHKFSHFVLTLQNHINTSALQASWQHLMQDLKDAQSMTDLYRKHTNYIKRIRFICMLNKHSAQFYSAIHDVFKLIIRFNRILKNEPWKRSTSDLIHPRYDKLVKIEENFDKLMRHIILMGWKIVSRGYQTEIGEFIFLLNSNEYYVSESEFK
ncbi:uncharacterized protein LOC132255687 [Phlebotomus argentipes]|uniref:uncharacterized protein LOC132255687 n=1 Tax=Phlebotomus argentipes TaxID=94469 RepID=UPI002892AB1A|nr:uncharacterized protein LOC132255687 [Phlebotomus argentipes]